MKERAGRLRQTAPMAADAAPLLPPVATSSSTAAPGIASAAVPLLSSYHGQGAEPPPPPPSPSLWRTARLLLTVAAVAVGSSFQFGFGSGVLNNAEPLVRGSLEASGSPLGAGMWGLVVSGFSIGGLMGSLISSSVLLLHGRKPVLLACNGLVLASSLLLIHGTEWPELFAGRVLAGLVGGIAAVVVPAYLAELATARLRSLVGTAHQLGVTVGLLVAQALSTPSLGLLGAAESWRFLFLVPLVCSLVQCAVLPFCPESPEHLYRTKGSAAALHKLAELHAAGSVGANMERLRAESADADADGGFTISEVLAARPLRRQLLVGLVLMVAMQLSGVDAILLYSTLVLRAAGLPEPQETTTTVALVNVALVLVSAGLLDAAGRRRLLLASWAGMSLSYALLTLALVGSSALGLPAEAMSALALLGMLGAVACFALGPGCVAWFVLSEIFPSYARDAAMALSISLNWLANWLVALSFPAVHEQLGACAFLPFALATALFALFTYRLVPETKGLSYAQVQLQFERLPLLDHPWLR